MMNMQNLGLQESIEVKYVSGIWAKFCVKDLFEINWYFCNITEPKWF